MTSYQDRVSETQTGVEGEEKNLAHYGIFCNKPIFLFATDMNTRRNLNTFQYFCALKFSIRNHKS